MEAVIKTYSGAMINVTDPNPRNIRIEDIAHALSCINLYNGHYPVPVSVAAHSLKVLEVLKRRKDFTAEMGLHGLLNRSSEAYLTNLPKPIKNEMKAYWGYEQVMMDVIFGKYGIEEHKYAVQVEEAETQVDEFEQTAWTHEKEHPLGERKDWKIVKINFLKAYTELNNLRNYEK